MPRGFSSIKQATKRFSDDAPKALLLKLKDGQSANVRFLEEGDDVYFYMYHDFSHLNGMHGWKTKVPCLDQEDTGEPCPGCEARLPRKFEGLINIIWRDAPKYAKDKDGNIDWDTVEGREDQVAIWRQGVRIFQKTLPVKDDKYKGLMSRDFEISRDGSTKDNTSYSIEPVDVDSGPQPLSAKDKKLAEEKHDLDEFARFVDYDRFQEIIEKKTEEFSNDGDDEGDEDEDDIRAFIDKQPLATA
jgi:hypothetical protein